MKNASFFVAAVVLEKYQSAFMHIIFCHCFEHENDRDCEKIATKMIEKFTGAAETMAVVL